MSGNPFKDLTFKPVWQARLGRWRDLALRPVRPSRVTPDRPGPANLLLVGIDTLRADHLGLGGYSGPTSPCLDHLAGRGTVFSDATAAAPWTLPSFSSALTGLMPGLHGAYLSGDIRNMDHQPPRRLADNVTTLATHLSGQGYRTAAFYSNQFFAFGLAETFDHHSYHNLPAQDLSRLAEDWIRRHSDRPWFCFVLFNDPHEPTTPPREDLDPFLPGAEARGAAVDDAALRSYARWGEDGAPHLGRADAEDPDLAAGLAVKLAVYDAAIHQVDRAVGRLQDRLDNWGLAARTLVSVFSDHGEEFRDHAGFARSWNHDPRDIRGIGHGHSHFQELLHVPWVAWGPGVPSGQRCREPVSLCDLSPTLLDWLELPALPRTEVPAADGPLTAALCGHSQAAAAEGRDRDGDRLLLSEAIAFGPDLVALRRGRWKLIAHRDGRPLALFDLLSGPEEQTDLAEANPETVARLLADLTRWRESGTGADGADRESDTGGWDDMNDEIRQRLKDLGYSE